MFIFICVYLVSHRVGLQPFPLVLRDFSKHARADGHAGIAIFAPIFAPGVLDQPIGRPFRPAPSHDGHCRQQWLAVGTILLVRVVRGSVDTTPKTFETRTLTVQHPKSSGNSAIYRGPKNNIDCPLFKTIFCVVFVWPKKLVDHEVILQQHRSHHWSWGPPTILATRPRSPSCLG